MNRRILTLIYTLCICIAFLNYISLKNELEFLHSWLNEASELLGSNAYFSCQLFLDSVESMKFQYFLALSRVVAVTILCVGFAIICQWKMESLQLGPLVNKQLNHIQNNVVYQHLQDINPFRFLKKIARS